MTYGRIPDGDGRVDVDAADGGRGQRQSQPTARTNDSAWLYDPLQVTEIDLEASAAALSQLRGRPGRVRGGADHPAQRREHVRPLRRRPAPQGPRRLPHAGRQGRLQGQVRLCRCWRALPRAQGADAQQHGAGPLDDRRGHLVAAVAATGAPTARVGYAYVRLNGAEYGLYANVENVDAVMARRWFTGTQHIYEGRRYGVDASPGPRGRIRGGRRLVHRPLRPGGAGGGPCRRRGGLVGADAAGRRSGSDDPRLGRRALRRALGRLLDLRRRDLPGQLLPAQRPRGPLLAHHARAPIRPGRSGRPSGSTAMVS